MIDKEKKWMHYDDECMENEYVDEQKAKRHRKRTVHEAIFGKE